MSRGRNGDAKAAALMTRLMRTSKTAKLRATLEGGRKQRKSAFDTKLIFALNYVKISKKEDIQMQNTIIASNSLKRGGLR